MEELEGLSAQELLDKRDGIELEIREQLAVLEQVKLWETMNLGEGLSYEPPRTHHLRTPFYMFLLCELYAYMLYIKYEACVH